MFKTLISTFLLCSAVGSKGVTVAPRQSASLYTLYGGYCFRDTADFDTDFTTGTSYTFDFDYVGQNKPYCVDQYLSYDWVDSIVISKPNASTYTVSVSFGRSESVKQDGFADSTDLTDCDTWVQNFVIYFNNEISVGASYYTAFMSLFTQRGNIFNTVYNGYYTFTTGSVQNFPAFTILGSNLWNGNLGFMLTHDTYATDKVTIFSNSTTGPEYVSITDMISNGAINGQNFILLSNCLINNEVQNLLSYKGVFSYVQDTTDYDFKDLMVSIADTPITFLRGLFSFELFGIQLYIAFASVLTLVLIAVVIKKII